MKNRDNLKYITSKEDGAISVLTAISLSVIIAFTMLVVDGGMLYIKHKRLQYASDSAALAAVKKLDNYEKLATYILEENSLENALESIDRGVWDKDSETFTPDESGYSIRVRLKKEENSFFAKFFSKDLKSISANSIASLEKAAAVVSADSSLISINAKQSPLLNAIIGSLLDSNLKLSVGGWNNLIQTDIDLVKFLDLAKVHLDVGSTKELLKTDISLLEVIDLFLEALGADSLASAELSLFKESVLNADVVATLKVKMGELIKLDIGDERLASADLNLFSALTTAIGIFNGKAGIVNSTKISLPPLTNIGLNLQILNPPPMQIMQEDDSFESASVRLSLDSKVLGSKSYDGLINLSLYAALADQTTTLIEMEEDEITFDVSQSLAKIGIGKIDNSNFFDKEGYTLERSDIDYTNLVNLVLLKVKAKAFADGEGVNDSFTYEGPFPKTQSSSADNDAVISNLVTTLLKDLSIEVELLGLDLGLSKSKLINGLTDAVAEIVSALVSPLLADTLKLLGISLGEANVTVHSYAYKAVLVR